MLASHRRATGIKLHAGGGIRFGFMRQNNISGRMLSVTDVTSYLFETDSFVSYQLRDEETDISLIVVNDDRPQEAYMALSHAIREKWHASLFSALPVKEWFNLKEGEQVTVNDNAVIALQGWLAPVYTYVLTARGSKIAGDFRHRKMHELTGNNAESFDYLLVVSDSGEHAIELERYANGHVKAIATVYRPLSDIAETTQFQRPYLVASNPVEAISTKLPEAEMETATRSLKLVTHETGTAESLASIDTQQILATDTMLAERLMEEARRNNLSIADITRKVIGLPRALDDIIYTPLELSPKEQSMLATRYELPQGDMQGLQEKIVEELRQFVGLE